jgi:hypothetical protein
MDSLRMLTGLRLTTAQQRTTGQNLPSDLCYQEKLRYMPDNVGMFRYRAQSVLGVTISKENENVA